MRYTVLLPLLGLGLAGCVVAQPAPTTTTTTYHPATSETVITQPAGTYMAPSYVTPGTSTTTVVRTP